MHDELRRRPVRRKRNATLRLVLGTVVIFGTMSLAPMPAVADTPLARPSSLQAVHVSDTGAELTWLRDGSGYQDVVERKVDGRWREYARGLYGVLDLTGLTPGTTYTFRVYTVAYKGSGFTNSPRSAPVSFTTLPGPDSVPPSKPEAPTFSGVTTTVANVFWPEATDNVEVTGYHLQQLVDGGWTTVRTVGAAERFQSVGGLTPNTSYTFAVIAFDAQGNASPRSDPGTFTTQATTAALTCRVQVISYDPGFQATVTIVNTTATPSDGWTIQFALPATATTGPAFNGVLTRAGAVGTITPVAYDKVIGPGGQITVGFSGSAVPFTPPTGFTLNGVPCAS
ncbi:cellulose binding domain-containing protein [Microbispora sp. NPDC049125]|uniref:cellulose binding domain-containing protein n=1 Tax=Microbispora sp. NPDC049125 TaxID=3154929 RepID=UPI003467E266